MSLNTQFGYHFMGTKVGDKDIPKMRLSAALETTKSLYGRFAFDEIDHDTAARFLNYSNGNNGAYRTKVADLKSYQLLNPNTRSKIQVSSLGKSATYSKSEEEKNSAILEAMKSVELYRLIYEKYGSNPPNDLWPDLAQWSGAKPNEAQEIQYEIREAYLADLRNLSVTAQTELKKSPTIEQWQGQSTEKPFEEEKHSEATSEAPAKLTSKFGTILIVNLDTIDIAKAYLNLIEKELKSKEQKTESKE